MSLQFRISKVPPIHSRRPRCLRCEICKQCRSAGSSLKVILEVFYALFLLKVPFRKRRRRRSSEGEREEICPLTIKVSLYWLPLIPHHHRSDTLSIFQRYSLFKRNDMIHIHQSSNVFHHIISGRCRSDIKLGSHTCMWIAPLSHSLTLAFCH